MLLDVVLVLVRAEPGLDWTGLYGLRRRFGTFLAWSSDCAVLLCAVRLANGTPLVYWPRQSDEVFNGLRKDTQQSSFNFSHNQTVYGLLNMNWSPRP
jgi:hypothetical protein